jgi:hypothetical protein
MVWALSGSIRHSQLDECAANASLFQLFLTAH